MIEANDMSIQIAADHHRRRIVLPNKTALALSLLTMALLTVIAEPFGWYLLAWVALVPWVLAAVSAKHPGRMALISYLTGLIYYLANLYWLVGVTPLGYGALCFYLGWYFVVTGFILRRVYLKHRWPFTLLLPVVWVAQEYLRALVFTGFPWLFLAHSQHENLRLIQLCDTFGTYGLTFLIAMVNGLCCDLLLRPLKQGQNRRAVRLGPARLILLTVACLVFTWFYGHWRLKQGQNTITPGPILAMIQEAIPQYVKESGQSDEEIFQRHLLLTEQALAADPKPDLIVWPETMAPSPLNQEFLDLDRLAGKYDLGNFKRYLLSRSFDQQLRNFAQDNAALLVGTGALEMTDTLTDTGSELRISRKANSAVLYLPSGRRYPQRYDKMHLVPFGEVVPFRDSWPALYRLLNALTPYSYEYTLDPGHDPTVFEFPTRQGASSRFAVAICYEDVMPQVPRQLTAALHGQKRVDFLLNISNDGWFVRGANGDLTATTELLQHLVICKFRAVENRIPIARAVNTGISAFLRPDGAVQSGKLAGTLADDPTQRQVTAGFLTDRLYLDSRISPYARLGDTFAVTLTLLAAVLFLLALLPTAKKR